MFTLARPLPPRQTIPLEPGVCLNRLLDLGTSRVGTTTVAEGCTSPSSISPAFQKSTVGTPLALKTPYLAHASPALIVST